MKAGKMRGQQKRVYSLQSFARDVSYLPSSLPHSSSTPACTFTGMIRNLQLPGQKALSPGTRLTVLPLPAGQRLPSVSPDSLNLESRPLRHSSGPNHTLHHFPSEAEMGTDRSPSSGSDLHRPFHLHPPPYLPGTVFSFIWRVHWVPQQS